tara:strand:+ start:2310 stop:2735 length:426 start_codon:yes stop_codon:yes gene_type:complete
MIQSPVSPTFSPTTTPAGVNLLPLGTLGFSSNVSGALVTYNGTTLTVGRNSAAFGNHAAGPSFVTVQSARQVQARIYVESLSHKCDITMGSTTLFSAISTTGWQTSPVKFLAAGTYPVYIKATNSAVSIITLAYFDIFKIN